VAALRCSGSPTRLEAPFFLVSKKQPVEQVFDRIQGRNCATSTAWAIHRTVETPAVGTGESGLTVRNKSVTVQARDGYYPE